MARAGIMRNSIHSYEGKTQHKRGLRGKSPEFGFARTKDFRIGQFSMSTAMYRVHFLLCIHKTPRKV